MEGASLTGTVVGNNSINIGTVTKSVDPVELNGVTYTLLSASDLAGMTLGEGATLTINLAETLNVITSQTLLGAAGEAVDATAIAITGVTGLTADNFSVTGADALTTTYGDYLGTTVRNGTGYVLFKGIEADTPAVPEPTTTTLSLLALAGLCARRRRK